MQDTLKTHCLKGFGVDMRTLVEVFEKKFKKTKNLVDGDKIPAYNPPNDDADNAALQALHRAVEAFTPERRRISENLP